MYKIAIEDQDIVIRLSRDLVDKDVLSRFLDYIVLESIAKSSKLTEEQAAALANEVDRDVWAKMRQKLQE